MLGKTALLHATISSGTLLVYSSYYTVPPTRSKTLDARIISNRYEQK